MGLMSMMLSGPVATDNMVMKLTCVDITPFVKCVQRFKHITSDEFDVGFLEPRCIRCIKQVVIQMP